MTQQHAERARLIAFFTFGFSLVLLFACLTSSAQTPITPSGLNTGVSPPATLPAGKVQHDITGGTRPGGGVNLFHSFGDFNVPTNNIANFLNSGSVDLAGNPLAAGLPTSNILGRINGGNPSTIFGMIQTNGPGGFPNANLFLMNPTGFLFGPNATVQVGGMVSFTSADYLRLADGVRFNAVANPAADAVLSTAPVAAFGFLGSNPGAITVQGSQLTVSEGTGISLVGGNITVQSGVLADGGTVQSARLSAPGGQINLASVASPGEILTGTLGQAPNVNGQSFGDLGAIQVSEQSVIDVSGNGGGTVSIRGGQFLLDSSTISANVTGSGPIINGAESIGDGIDIQVSQNAAIQNLGILETNVTGNATPDVTYGGVRVKADRIEILGTVTVEDAFAGTGDFSAFTGIRSNINPGSTGGNSGTITLEANSVLVNNFATLDTHTESAGNGGNIIVRTNQNLEIDFGLVQSGATFSTGDAGNIELTSAHGNISTNFAFITSQTIQSPGTAGNLTLNAPSGNILIGDGTTLFTLIQPPINPDGVAAVRAGGSGGILINANNLEVIGAEMGITNGSNLLSGDLTVNLSGNLSFRGGSFGPSFVRALAQQPVDSTGMPLTTHGADSAGLNITAHDILITDGSSITTSTLTSGAAGPLNISAVNLQLTNGGQISSASRQGINFQTGLPFGPPPSGPAGTVTIQGLSSPAQSVLIDGTGSGIFTNTVGTGAGGNINILANSLTLQNGGTLSAATTGTAPSATGGTITVTANQVALNNQAVITADTNGIAPAGTVDINTGSLAINSGAQIQSSSESETEQLSTLAFSIAAPALTGGTISIQGQTGNGSQAGSVTVDGSGSGIFTQSSGNRPGGDINILTSGSATMTNGASISASSTGAGNAGNIQINAGNQLSMTNSKVTTEANQASGGAIKITTTPSGTVELTNSMISASVLDGTGGGGSVNIDPEFVILQNSQILANAVFGPGGNINITTNLLLPDSASVISASSQFGQQGTISIQSPISPASGKINPIGQRPLIPTSLVSQRCAALAGGNVSSFTVAGRDSLPAEPGSWLPSPLALETGELVGSTATAPETRTSLRGSTEEMLVVSLRRITPPGFLIQNFAADWATGCVS